MSAILSHHGGAEERLAPLNIHVGIKWVTGQACGGRWMGFYAVHEGRNEMGFSSCGSLLLFLSGLGAVNLSLRVSFCLSPTPWCANPVHEHAMLGGGPRRKESLEGASLILYPKRNGLGGEASVYYLHIPILSRFRHHLQNSSNPPQDRKEPNTDELAFVIQAMCCCG